LMNGTRAEMASRFIGLSGHLTVSAYGQPISDYAALASQLSQNPHVASTVPKIEGQVMASANGAATGAFVLAMPIAAMQSRELIAKNIDEAAFATLGEEGGVIVGEQLAKNLGLHPGDSITLISPQGQATIAGFIPRMKAYPVVATIKLGMHLYDSNLILMRLSEAQRYFKLPDQAQAVDIMLRDMDSLNIAHEALQAQVGSQLSVIDWQSANRTVFDALLVQRNVMVVILALIILVAAFNIIASLVMLVSEKRRGIAILRTIGATRGTITRVFMASGMMLGALGTLIGLLLGVFLAYNIEGLRKFIEKVTGQELLVENIYFLSTLPTKTDPQEVLAIVIASLVLSFLATLYPARRASSLDPAEVLRYE
jgi:lipoprotein-releasing system permease protein